MKLTIEQEANELRKEYFRKWRKENPEKTKLHNRTYWNKKAAAKKLQEKS